MVEDGWADVGRVPCYVWLGGSSGGNVLSWCGGEVVVTGTVDDLAELVAIAESLGANLVGDDQERYTRESLFE